MTDEKSVVQTLMSREENVFSALKLILFKTSPRHRFISLYSADKKLGDYGSRVKPAIVKFRSGPAYDMLFLLCFFKKHRDKEWVDTTELCHLYFGDDISLDTLHNYMESKLRGTLRKVLQKVFHIEATEFILRENNCYCLFLPKERIEMDKSVFEYGVPQEGDEARKARFKKLVDEWHYSLDVPPV